MMAEYIVDARPSDLFGIKMTGLLVRCKDCKHKEESVSPSWEAWCNRLHCGCDLDWFCADGERKQRKTAKILLTGK